MRGWLLAVLLLVAAPVAAAPSRVVSLNLCTDEFLILLAPGRAAALSPLARDPALSVVAAQAAGKPWVRPDAEAVLALRPDLVLAGPYGAQTTLAALGRHGVPILRTAMPQDFDGIRAETRRFAAALDAVAEGERLIAAMDAGLAAAPKGTGQAVLPLEARLYTAAAPSLADAVIRAAGLVNAADGERTDLESIAAHPPNMIVTASAPEFPSLATDLLRHRVLRGIPRRTWAPAWMACGGPWTVAAVRALAP